MNKWHGLSVGLFSLCLMHQLVAGVYTWRDANGVLQFSDRPPEPKAGVAAPKVKTIEVPEISTVQVRQLPPFVGTGQEATSKTAGKSKGKTPKVTMYSAEWCGVCKRAKRYFEEHKVRYTEKDIDKSKSANAEFRKLGGRGVPLILVGRKRLSGFSVASFEKIYSP